MNNQYKRQNNFNKENYYSPRLSLPKDLEPIIKKKGEQHGSVTAYIKFLIKNDISKEEGGGNNP